METVELVEQAYAFTRERIVGIGDAPLDGSTPCAEWDLRHVVNHAVNAAYSLAEVLAGDCDIDPWSRSPDELAAADSGWPQPVEKFDEAQAKIADACRDGALERLFPARDMQLPGEMLARAAVMDATIHGWDIAKATGQDTTIPSAVAEELLPLASGLPDEARGLVFGAKVETSETDSVSDRLLALLGRQP